MTTNETYHAEYDTAAQGAQTTTDGYIDLAGVTAEKSVVMTDEGILQITFDIASTRSEPVHIEIRDLIPESIHLDRVGFHPDYGRENWSIEHENQVVFESTLDPHGDLHTIYAIKPDGPSDLSTVSTETEIVGTIDDEPAPATGASEPAPATDESEPSSEQHSDATEAAGGGIDEVVPQELPGQNEESRIPPASEGADAADPVDEDVSGVGSDNRDTADGDGLDDDPSPEPESEDGSGNNGELIAQLASELSDGRASDEDLAVLGDHFASLVEPESSGGNSFDARLQRAERELNELSAYTDALSEFLDERGSGQEILDDLKDRTANVESRLETVAGEVEGLDDRIETTTDEVGDLDDRHEETCDRLDGVTDRLNTIDVHIETLENDLSTLRGSHDEAGDRIDRIEESVERLDDRLDAAEDARDAQQDSLTAEIEAMAEDLEQVRSWHRDFGRLLEEFGTVGSDAVDDEDAEEAEHADTSTDGPSATAAESETDEADGSEPESDEPNGDEAEPNAR